MPGAKLQVGENIPNGTLGCEATGGLGDPAVEATGGLGHPDGDPTDPLVEASYGLAWDQRSHL